MVSRRCALPLMVVVASWLAPALAQTQTDANGFYPKDARPRATLLAAGSPLLRIDGRLDEPVWQAAPVHAAFVQYLPTDRQPAPAAYRTTLQVVLEPHAIVFGIRCDDPRPGEIRAPLTRRDQVRRDQDFVSVLLDPVGTRRSAQFVRVSAAGVVADGTYIADKDEEDYAPDFDVEAAVQRDESGYSVELRLPLLALRYPYEGGAPWRVMVARSVPRAASMLLLSAPLTKDALDFISELQTIDGLEDVAERVRSHALLAVRPEFNWRSTRQRDEQGQRGASRAALGADIKWRPRADWVFDATLNPDFSQVELDVPQLAGNTRFALSVPEKRPFFLESTDVLDLPLAAFYSRSVTDPGWGVRATWRGSRADAVALSLRDDGGGLILLPRPYLTEVVPQTLRSQASLLRGRVQAPSFTAGALLGARDYAHGRFNRVAGADLLWRDDPQQQWRLRALGSQTSALFDATGAAQTRPREDGQQLFASWKRRVPGWNFSAEASQTSPRFRNDIGFVDQAGVRTLQAEVIRRFGEVAGPGFTAYEVEGYLWARETRTLADAREGIGAGEVTARLVHPGVWLVADHNTEAWLQWQLDAERAAPGRRLHPLRAVAGSYGVNPAPWFTRLTAEIKLGDRLDVAADRVGRGAVWMLDAKLRAGLLHGFGLESEQRIEQGWIDAPDGSRALTDTALRWLGVLHFSAQDSLRLVWQATQFVRHADVAAGLVAARADSRTTSLVLQRRFALGRSLSIGASRQTERPGARLDTELFAKASFEVSP